MSTVIRPLAEADLEALSRFLTTGFHTPADAEFAAVDLLRWKFLDPRDDAPGPRSFVAVDESTAAIVGHVGICPTAFAAPGLDAPVPALHMIDWLGSREHRSVGASLMRRAHETAPVQFGLGGSRAGRAVIKRGGYEPMSPVFVYERLLSPLRRLRAGGLAPKSAARAARDVARSLVHRPGRPVLRLELEPVSSFGTEVDEVVRGASRTAVVTARTAERLNYALRHPRRRPSGFLFRDAEGRVRGFALAILPPGDGGRLVLGRVADLLLDDDDPDAWHAALLLLSREMSRLGADVAQAFASPPWIVEALRRAGFIARHPLDFNLRDRESLLPHDAPFYLTPIEADYAYT